MQLKKILSGTDGTVLELFMMKNPLRYKIRTSCLTIN